MNYGVLIGRPVERRREGGTDSPHYQLHLATDAGAHYRAAGDPVVIRWVRNAGHVDLIAPGTAAWAVAVQSINTALKR